MFYIDSCMPINDFTCSSQKLKRNGERESKARTIRTPYETFQLTVDLLVAACMYVFRILKWVRFSCYFYAILYNHTAGHRPENIEKSSVGPPCGSLL